MDRSVKPVDDFYRYANGGWIKLAPIPLESGYVVPGGYEDDSSDLSPKRSADSSRSNQSQRPL
jgi:predicted metalloendopeptidase